ncbi:CopD family protein [Chitiniphilus eburneus]|uniref:Protoporphyrinogen IX oxidase n=1 Tax=Chitiniphilus eburneus TaxID=2571148 RepID=A0A4U0Q8B3_9NEIS|nr:CopD family protein [Chitiniphilus eburneus]TJZ77511.1 CopD family protein [Chitiniphilus eburneus]
MLWAKSFHLIFVTCWFAGLFYLPRLFVNHAQVQDEATAARLLLMERKLLRFMTALAVLALGFGVLTWSFYGFYAGPGWYWMHAKLTLVATLVLYHGWCWRLYLGFVRGKAKHNHVWYRWFNEFPVLILFAVVILAIVKPF